MTNRTERIVCSVILPAIEDGPGVQRGLAALCEQNVDFPYEVIVVSPGAIDLSASPNARLVHDDGRGPGAALNCGISAATGEVLALTDAECVSEPGWLAAGLAAINESDLVAGRIEQTPAVQASPTSVEEFEMRWSLRQDIDVRSGVASGSNLFMHRRVFALAGPFREDMASKYDWEFCGRALRAGFRLSYCDGAIVRHPVISTWRGLWQSKLRLARGMAELHRVQGQTRATTRLHALRQLRPPLRSLIQVFRRQAPLTRKFALAGTLLVSRAAYLVGWLRSELRSR